MNDERVSEYGLAPEVEPGDNQIGQMDQSAPRVFSDYQATDHVHIRNARGSGL